MHSFSVSKIMVHWKNYSSSWSEQPLLITSCSCVPFTTLGTASLGIRDMEVTNKNLWVDIRFTLQCKNPRTANHLKVVLLSLCLKLNIVFAWHLMSRSVSLGEDREEVLLHVLLVHLFSPFSICLVTSPSSLHDGAFLSTENTASGIDPDLPNLDRSSTNFCIYTVLPFWRNQDIWSERLRLNVRWD